MRQRGHACKIYLRVPSCIHVYFGEGEGGFIVFKVPNIEFV